MRAEDPVLTIFIPAYNTEAYLSETIESLLSQSFRDFELIIADDGSSDRTAAIAEDYACKDCRVRLIRSPHRGEVAARNKALSAAHPSSRYFLNHDADDVSLPGKLESQIQYLDGRPEISVVGTLAEYFNDRGERLGNLHIEVTPERIRETFHHINSMIHSASMIRREVFETIGGYRPQLQSVDDYDYFMRALLAGFCLANIPQVLHKIRLHDRSVGSTRAALQQELAIEVQSIYLKHRGSTEKVILHSPLALSKLYRPHASSLSKGLRRSTNPRKLRILHTVQMYHPQVGGSEEVVKQLSERLAQRGHHVTVATGFHPDRNFSNWNGVEIRQFRIEGNRVHGISGEIEAYKRFLLENNFDIVLNYAAQIWSSDLVFPLLDRIRAAKIFVPCGYSALLDPAYRTYFEQMPGTLQKYDRVVHLSANYRDAHLSRNHGLLNSMVIGNAASEEEFLQPSEGFRQRYGIETPHLIITVANHYHGKGHGHLLKWFQQMRRDDVTLAIIGERTTGGCWEECLHISSSLPQVRLFESLPRKDVVAAFKDADLFWFGSDVECFPLVILEAMAARTAWLSTDVGNAPELPGGWISEPDQMARKASTLLDSKALRTDLAQKGHQEWKDKYTWQRIVDQYEQLYLSVASAKSSHAVCPSEDPFVSVVIPCFKQAHYLSDAVESVVEQTYRNFEIIIINDGSPDDTKQVAQALINKHPKQSIRLISQTNQGLAASRNAGIRAARGSYILPLDADDKIKPGFLQACTERVSREPELSIIAVNLEEFGDSNRRISCGVPLLKHMAIENQINYCSLYPKSLWEKVGGYRPSMRWGYEDWEFWISSLEKGARVSVISEHLFLYRKRGASMYSSALEHSTELQAQIALNHPELYDKGTLAWAAALFRIKEDPEDASAHELLARYYTSRARWSEAIPHLAVLTARPPFAAEMLFLFGVAKLKVKEFAAGRLALRRFLDERPDNATAHFLSAIASASLGDLNSAREDAEDAIELDLKMTAGFELLIAISRAQKDPQVVNDLLERSTELQIQLAPWIFSDSVFGGNDAMWADVLYAKYIQFSPLPLLQMNPRGSDHKSHHGRPSILSTKDHQVSVIMPTYNRPDTLVAAIDSVLKQTWQNFEIVVINDAGVDVEPIVRKMNTAGKITYIRHGKNQGLASARNTGIKLARGKYIAYLDDDDLFYPDHLQTLVHCLENNDCAVAYTDAYRAHQIQRDGRAVVVQKDLPFSCDFDHDRILVGNFIPVLCVMHQKRCLETVGLFDESLTTHEDWDLWIRMSRQYRFGHVRKVTCEFSWRTDGTSMTSAKQTDFVKTLEIIYEKGREYTAGKQHVVDAQKEYLRAKRDNLHISEASEATKSSSNAGIAAVLGRVQRYISLGKKDMAARIIQKELKHLKNGSETVQQRELVVLYQSIGLASTASMRGIDSRRKD
jgi:glycosyltransferase involved in cell wall biosynthesis